MYFLIFSILLYFLPTLIGRHKTDAAGIFLVNLLFGWTVIGWVVALFWACTGDNYVHVPMHAAHVSGGRFCSQCGTLGPYGAHFCSACGKAV